MHRHRFCIRAIVFAVLISCSLAAQSHPNPSNHAASTPVIEGSGSPAPIPGNRAGADIDWEASGLGPDDEDGDVIEGSGGPPEVEGSGIPLKESTTTMGAVTPGHSTSTSTSASSTTKVPSSSLGPVHQPIATTVITITTEETKRHEEDVFNVQKPVDENELKFGENDDDGDDDDSDEDDNEDVEPTTPETTTTERLTTTPSTTTTKRPAYIEVAPTADSEADDDVFKNMFEPGILAAITGGAVVGILLAILLVMFIVYRIRKKDEGSYSVDESSHHQPHHYSYAYQKAATKEFYA